MIEVHDTIFVPTVPSTVGPLMAYARLIGGVGAYTFRFEIHDLDGQEIVLATEENLIEFGSAEEVVALTANYPSLDLTRLGPHDLVLFANDWDGARFTFRVVPYPDEEEGDGAQDDEDS